MVFMLRSVYDTRKAPSPPVLVRSQIKCAGGWLYAKMETVEAQHFDELFLNVIYFFVVNWL